MKQKKNKNLQNKKLCKKCGLKKRYSLFYCKDCLKIHNNETVNLKKRLRQQNRCVDCAKDLSLENRDGKRYCKSCMKKARSRDMRYRINKKIKSGAYQRPEEILKVI